MEERIYNNMNKWNDKKLINDFFGHKEIREIFENEWIKDKELKGLKDKINDLYIEERDEINSIFKDIKNIEELEELWKEKEIDLEKTITYQKEFVDFINSKIEVEDFYSFFLKHKYIKNIKNIINNLHFIYIMKLYEEGKVTLQHLDSNKSVIIRKKIKNTASFNKLLNENVIIKIISELEDYDSDFAQLWFEKCSKIISNKSFEKNIDIFKNAAKSVFEIDKNKLILDYEYLSKDRLLSKLHTMFEISFDEDTFDAKKICKSIKNIDNEIILKNIEDQLNIENKTKLFLFILQGLDNIDEKSDMMKRMPDTFNTFFYDSDTLDTVLHNDENIVIHYFENYGDVELLNEEQKMILQNKSIHLFQKVTNEKAISISSGEVQKKKKRKAF